MNRTQIHILHLENTENNMYRKLILLIFVVYSGLVGAKANKWVAGISGVGRETASSVTAHGHKICMSGGTQGGELEFHGISSIETKEIKPFKSKKKRNSAILACTDESGDLINLSDLHAEGVVKLNDIEFSDDGSLYISGYFANKLYLPQKLKSANKKYSELTGESGVDGFIAKYSNKGKLQWFKLIGNKTGTQALQLHALTNNEGVLLQGVFYQIVNISDTISLKGKGSRDHYLISLDTGGNINWAKHWPIEKGTIIAGGVTANENYVYETFTHESDVEESLGRKDVILIKRELQTGKVIWQKRLGGTSMDTAVKPVTDSQDRVFTAVNFQNAITAPQFKEEVRSEGVNDYLIVGYDGTGHLVYHKHVGTKGADILVELYLREVWNELIFNTFDIAISDNKVRFHVNKLDLASGNLTEINVAQLLPRKHSVQSIAVSGNQLIYTGVIEGKEEADEKEKENHKKESDEEMKRELEEEKELMKLKSFGKTDMYIAGYHLKE